MKEKKALSLKTLTKSNVWDIQENDVFRLWEAAEKEADLRDNQNVYINIIRSAFDIEEIKIDKPEIIKKYEQRGFKVGYLRLDSSKDHAKWAIKKKPIMRVTDLTYENIRHISAAKLLEVINRNFGGGWESLSQSIQDIIESGFLISVTTLPADRLHKAGSMYEKKIYDGYEVLEIPKGTWTEAIFAKEKPELEKQHFKFEDEEELDRKGMEPETENEEEETTEVKDNYNEEEEEEEEDVFDDDKLTEESYHTNFDETPEDLNLEAEDVVDDDDDTSY